MTAPLTLVTIPISHFCEKARWALDRAGIPYVERRHVQLVHVAAAALAARSRTVPVLVGGGVRLTESADIVAWADPGLYPAGHEREVRALEREFDEGLGPDGRLWMYHGLLGRRDIALAFNLTGVPRWEARALTAAYPLFGWAIDRVLDVDDAAAGRAETAVRATFDRVGALIADGRRYLAAGRFTAADLAFAALSAPVLVPDAYAVPLPAVDDLPAAMATMVRELRDHPAGRHALRMFDEERRPAPVGA